MSSKESPIFKITGQKQNRSVDSNKVMYKEEGFSIGWKIYDSRKANESEAATSVMLRIVSVLL